MMDAPHPQEEKDIPYSAEVARKLLHLVALVIPLLMWYLGREWSVALLLPLAMLTSLADVLRVRAMWFHRLVDRVFGFMMRGKERPPFGGEIVLNGATCIFISAALLAVVFPVAVGAPALATFMIADAAAALVGRRWGRRHWPRSERTFEGSAAFVVTALAILSVLGIFPLPILLSAVVLGAVVEALPGPLNDNIQVPFVMALVLAASTLPLFAF